MYCKNCGNRMDHNAVICVKCGYAKGTGNAYCTNCGHAAVPGAAACTNCGAALTAPVTGESKSKLGAGLLGIFLGWLGVHNFYLGYIGKGIAQLLISILGWCLIIGPFISSVWGLIEGIYILTGRIATDAKGIPLKD